ncbi:MAG: lysophospholipid acyltransferase family protein [Acidobacteriaceae bacterium]
MLPLSDPATRARAEAPRISKPLLRLFLLYCDFFFRRRMHRLLVSGSEHLQTSGPIIIYLNHPSWWDPIICWEIGTRLMPGRNHYAPMDADAMEHYKFFRKLGVFPVKKNSIAGARRFLAVTNAILRDPSACLWITAQGMFTDVRQRPLKIMSGVSHLHAPSIPLALDYTFFEESKPEVLARFGPPLPPHSDKTALTAALARELEFVTCSAITRNVDSYLSILSGRAGVGGIYDCYRELSAHFTGARFTPEHAAIHGRKAGQTGNTE